MRTVRSSRRLSRGVSAPGWEGVCLLPEGCLLWGGIPACIEVDTPRVDRHTPVKT